ncbi:MULTISPECIES: ATP-grasp domain-containing protein [Bacillus]|uniref:Carbamoylphosphate synthase large subunit short form n=1 Tax=Bacillus pumilus (strain SAFR-032) TaxID=315750 RepID=A8FI10_BACP2|nr:MULTISPECIES: ATP-grasp domain-containing protein [Bacillus]ABV63877.1 carbamoylphosphate synthase large subunit short form [Bacillus pumilus SAFR-032]MBC3641361.1 ATP-grasp domain-containing protein [Bacillus pumilus]MBC3646989.1 ATP-grasp domain-containing protein [Bacillus pumilus]MBC3648317.1 ATP-grasp domain-containing protein [Bacillus pumilus]MBC3652277.1 ATP-grasp domain-containing protein [Bacillus pumilus]
MKNVLVFPCGSEIGLEIHNSLKFSKDFELIGASSVSDHGKYVYKNYIENVPEIHDEDFIDKLNHLIDENKIDFIIPAHDSVVLKLAQNQKRINAIVVTSDQLTCEVARSKKKTYEFFKKQPFVPKMYKTIEEVEFFPVFLKPDVGQGSKGIALARDKKELEFYKNNNSDLLILEYLPGKEYTIDCFTNKNGELKYAGRRERKRIKSGISVNSATLQMDEQTKQIADEINKHLQFRGAWFFQIKEDVNGDYKLLEVAPRIAGTMALYRNKGVNFPLLSLYDRMDFNIKIEDNGVNLEVDRALINRFTIAYSYQRVYVDFDDTITYKDKVNPLLMLFLYQCFNSNKEIILITKHIHNIKETLEKLRINANLFNRIIHLEKEDIKSKYIDNQTPSIFIDDSFSERDQIKAAGIPVFDVDSIESLIDWRS